ncbi:glycosyltransferase [Polynucleobacter paneuropaeus]|nr:glycosyltransferase [Polynucleobacter paneuropaeus]
MSVIMNCFNGEEFLSEAIESVLGQTYTNWEIIFWDNLSTDSGAQIFRRFNDLRLKYYCAIKHTPLYEARNKAIEKASGELIAFLDVDDIWVKNKLELQVPLFQNQNIGFSCGKYILINQRKSKNILTNVFAEVNLPDGFVTNDLLGAYFIHVSTLMVRKTVLDKILGPCDPRFNIIGDLDLAINLSLISEFSPVQQSLAYYRWHDTNTGIAKAFSFCDEFDKWFLEKDLDPRINQLSGYLGLKNKNVWSKCIKSIYEGKKINAIKLSSHTHARNRLKVWLASLLPTCLIKKIIER